MGHYLVFGRRYSPVFSLKASGEQSKAVCSKYDPMHGIGSTSQEFKKVRIVRELTISSSPQGGKSGF